VIPVTITKRSYSTVERPRLKKCYHCPQTFYPKNDTKIYCLDCHDEVDRQKKRAHNRIKTQIEHGKMLRPTSYECWDCGKPADRYDHRDYGKPLDVQPVCLSCNSKRGPAKLGPIYLPRTFHE